MKRYYTIAIGVIALLLAGCIGEDSSDCPVYGKLILNPALYGSDELTKKVGSIDAFVYDIDHQMVAHTRVTKNGGSHFPEISFTVDPGEYNVVCWANVGVETRIEGLDNKLPLEKCYLETISNQTSSSLYYAIQRTIVVPPNRVTPQDIYFIRAHRTIGIYLKDYEIVHEAMTPEIRINNLPVCSDFLLHIDPLRRSYESQSTPAITTDGQRMMATFNTMITPFTDDMLIEVISKSNNKTVTTVNLKQYVDDNILKIDDINEFNIEIHYLMNGSIEIVMPGWEEKPLEPEW
ncbi:FimB/Mfa2 family fimbrial subunit [Bacteroides sp. 519]|uniref:FimB/Mfa2 family fimbrial subunit n=1 Tax=Bacteroides sp. 519 TaxID=2302937 RepID=UPI0013D73E70|nr:FimB/Mfa2 family fimbrial subunit [Bacteroides sp. 519]NDV60009.1 hypothetical protein [Bacteroides sp. 519]